MKFGDEYLVQNSCKVILPSGQVTTVDRTEDEGVRGRILLDHLGSLVRRVTTGDSLGKDPSSWGYTLRPFSVSGSQAFGPWFRVETELEPVVRTR